MGEASGGGGATAYRDNARESPLSQPHATLLDSLLHGDFHSTLPGLVILVTPSFDPTAAPALGRGSSAQTAVLRRWAWRDGGATFAEDTAHASLLACNLN